MPQKSKPLDLLLKVLEDLRDFLPYLSIVSSIPFSGLFLSFLLFFSGCSPFRPLRIESLATSASYDELFPYHVEICALSRIKPVNGMKGSRAGHGVLFLEGACRDETPGFPQLRLCRDPDLTEESESGVGLSVNRMFRNVNWVAVPGQRFFYYGNLQKDEILTEDVRKKQIKQAVDLGIYRGVKIHDAEMSLKHPEMSEEEFVAAKGLGTDYALNFGRSILCMKVPVTRTMMEEMISYLNRLNRRYALTEEEYQWDVLSDNCTHTIYNALASVHMLDPRYIKSGRIKKFFNLAIPSHAVVATLKLASPDPLDDIQRIKKDSRQSKTLMKYGWLPMRHGVLLSVLPMNQNNELYEVEISKFETLILRSATLKSKRRRLMEAFSDPRVTDLRTNLQWFEDQYETILENCRTRKPPKGFNGDFYERYCSYIAAQLKDVRDKIVQGYQNNSQGDRRAIPSTG